MATQHSFRKYALSVRACLALIQALLLTALTAVGVSAWFAINDATRMAQELALVSRGQRFHQQSDTMHDALRADVSAALLVAADRPDDGEIVLASVRDNARSLTAAIDALQKLPLPADLAQSVADARPRAAAYIARATAITAIAVRNHERGLLLKGKFDEAFEELRQLNDATTALFAQATARAEQQATQAAFGAQRWIIAAAVGVAILTCLLVELVGRSLRRSLRLVRDAATEIAEGDLSVRSDVRGRDEVGALARAVNKMADELQSMIDRLRAEAERDAFGTQLAAALEMSDTEEAVHLVAARAMTQIASDLPMELLLSDSSRAHLERAAAHPTAGAPGCGVESPFNCVAVRRGNPAVFADSEALDACPRLRDRPSGAVSAVCVPLSFMGRSLGVLHTTGAVGTIPTPEQIAQLTALGIQAGARIGTVRAFEKTQVQARTDSLTGLNNRRSLEQAARGLVASQTNFAFVLADLDYFKRLNDSHGHEAGDKALRLFADVLKKAVRDSDLPARWGGEEFAIFFPKATALQAFDVIERLRADLAQALLVSQCPPFTASFGIADSSMGTLLEDIVRVADDALYRSKHAGRDRATIGDPKLLQPAQRPSSDQRAAIDMKMLVNEN